MSSLSTEASTSFLCPAFWVRDKEADSGKVLLVICPPGRELRGNYTYSQKLEGSTIENLIYLLLREGIYS